LGRTRRDAQRDEGEQVLRGIERKSGDGKVERERPGVCRAPAQLRRQLVHRQRLVVVGEIRDDAVRELGHRGARYLDLVVGGPGEVPPRIDVGAQRGHSLGCVHFARRSVAHA